jgi:hypothetical protein
MRVARIVLGFVLSCAARPSALSAPSGFLRALDTKAMPRNSALLSTLIFVRPAQRSRATTPTSRTRRDAVPARTPADTPAEAVSRSGRRLTGIRIMGPHPAYTKLTGAKGEVQGANTEPELDLALPCGNGSVSTSPARGCCGSTHDSPGGYSDDDHLNAERATSSILCRRCS